MFYKLFIELKKGRAIVILSVSFILFVILHNMVYALTKFEEGVFFTLALLSAVFLFTSIFIQTTGLFFKRLEKGAV